MICCNDNQEFWAIGSDNIVAATVLDEDGAAVIDATVRYQLQREDNPDPLPTGDPLIVDEGPMPYDGVKEDYRATSDKAKSSTLLQDEPTHTFIFSEKTPLDDLIRLDRLAQYKES